MRGVGGYSAPSSRILRSRPPFYGPRKASFWQVPRPKETVTALSTSDRMSRLAVIEPQPAKTMTCPPAQEFLLRRQSDAQTQYAFAPPNAALAETHVRVKSCILVRKEHHAHPPHWGQVVWFAARVHARPSAQRAKILAFSEPATLRLDVDRNRVSHLLTYEAGVDVGLTIEFQSWSLTGNDMLGGSLLPNWSTIVPQRWSVAPMRCRLSQLSGALGRDTGA